MKIFLEKYLKYIVLLLLLYMPLFGHLGSLPIRLWDESRLAINAFEMLNDHDYLVTHYNGEPDMWNTKPPLLIWMQVGFMKMIGVNETAVRLPSAIAGFLTCLLLLVFSLRYLKNFWFGFIAALVLVTSHGYVNYHATRTGDYDAMLALFTTLSGLCFFTFCEYKKNRQLYLFFAFTTLAILTKSITGLLFLPALVIYALIQKQILPLLKNKHFYIALLSSLFVVCGYYGLRELYNPGYTDAVFSNEFGGRFLGVIENHQQEFWYYYLNFVHFQLDGWYLFVPCGLIIGLYSKDEKIKRLVLFTTAMIIFFFLVISVSRTKLEWYDVPLYPFLAILIAVFIHFIFELLKNFKWINNTLALNIVPLLFLFLVSIGPYKRIIDKTYKPTENSWDASAFEISNYLRDAIKGKHNVNGQLILEDGYNAHSLFYVKYLKSKGVAIDYSDWKNLNIGDRVIANLDHVKQYVEENYNNEVLERTTNNVVVYKINGRKD